MKRTPLYETHRALGARLIEFGGWEMPVHYSSIVDEHLCVRKSAGIFDISHMGEVLVRGSGSLAFLNQLLTNDVAKLAVGMGQYSIMCNAQGGVVDDLYVYRLEDEVFLMIVNASRIEVDVEWIRGLADKWPDVSISDESARWGAVAVQGPRVVQFIDECFVGRSMGGTGVEHPTGLRKNQLAQFVSADGTEAWVSRTGYTGEDGFELLAAADKIAGIWAMVMARGHVGCLQPCGLGARDTLRTEVCYPLFGHELTETVTPVEAGLGFFVATEKPAFVGRDVLLQQRTEKPGRRVVAFRMTSRSAPPRPQYSVYVREGTRPVGEVTSGTQSPSLGIGIGLAIMGVEHAQVGKHLEIEIRGRRCPAEIVKKPIYKKPPH